MTLVVLVPLTIGIGLAVVTVMGQLSLGIMVMCVSAQAMLKFVDLGLVVTTPWWAVWGFTEQKTTIGPAGGPLGLTFGPHLLASLQLRAPAASLASRQSTAGDVHPAGYYIGHLDT
jgi:hypothetical protein